MSLGRCLLNALMLTLAVGVLAGCFRSDKPLIDKARAVFPFEELTVKTEDGETAILRRSAEGYLFEEPGKAPSGPAILLHPVAEHVYIAQEASEGGRSIYLFARRDGNKIATRAICRGLDQAVLARLGLQREKDGDPLADCFAKDLKSLTELAKTPELWANETKTLEIVSIK